MKETIGKFIDDLVEGEETVLGSKIDSLTVYEVLRQEFDSKNLQPIELRHFDGNPAYWPKFIESFRSKIHFKQSFTESIRMERLLSVLEGEAKRSVESIGISGIFYTTTLKTLKQDFGKPIVIAHLKMKHLFKQPQIKRNDRTELRKFHQHLKGTNTWLLSIGYEFPLLSYDSLTRCVARLPNDLRKQFFKSIADSSFTDGSVNLIVFEKWLEKKLRSYFNPLKDIIPSEETEYKRFHKGFKANEQRYSGRLNQTNTDYKIAMEDIETGKKDKISSKVYECWICKGDHCLMQCDEFRKMNIKERKETVRKHKLCWNCLSKGHQINDCKSTVKCREYNKRHHTLLHHDQPMSTDNQAPSEAVINTVNNDMRHHVRDILLQVIAVNISNNNRTVTVNAFLDSGADSTIIDKEVATTLGLQGINCQLNLSSAISATKTLPSKFVSFQLSSPSHPNLIKLSNIWIVDDLNIPFSKVSFNLTKKLLPHIQDLPLPATKYL